MLISPFVVSYQHLDFGCLKVACSIVCQNELFREVYYHAHALYYVAVGTAIIHAEDGTEVTLREHEVVLLPQHSRVDIHKFRQEPTGHDFSALVFYLLPDFVAACNQPQPQAEANAPDKTGESTLLNLGRHEHFREFAESLRPLFRQPKVSKPLLQAKALDAVGLLAQHHPGLLNFLRRHAQPVKMDVYEFMLHNAFSGYSVAELAQLSGRSLSAFKRDFYQVFHRTPHHWMLLRKMDYAEDLLLRNPVRLSELSLVLGFKELSHFSAAFKKVKGFPPSQLVPAGLPLVSG